MGDDQMLSAREVATKLKMEPKKLRAILHSMGEGSKRQHYGFHEKDVPRLVAAVKEHQLNHGQVPATK